MLCSFVSSLPEWPNVPWPNLRRQGAQNLGSEFVFGESQIDPVSSSEKLALPGSRDGGNGL